jgi:signal transduction histidine kinase
MFNRLIRPTIRLRLTLTYGVLFLLAGAFLLALTYVLLNRALRQPDAPRRGDHQPESAIERQYTPAQIDALRREERQSALRQVRIQAWIALVVTSAGALLLGWLIAGQTLAPIREITAHAQHASEETLNERIDLRGPPDELKELADTFDSMLDRLQAAFESQRRFAAQASHELRTPLAIIRAESDVTLAAPDVTEREEAFATSIRDAADRSERLVDGLLALARSESTLRDSRRVDLAELAGDVVGEQTDAADAAGVELDLDLGEGVVNGDRALLWRLIGNLVENAIRYNRPGGWARIRVGTEGANVMLKVENSGPIIAPDIVDSLFEPFQRGATGSRSRASGHGLGLTIVRSVAAAHGGEVTALALPEGGLSVTVTMPAVA